MESSSLVSWQFEDFSTAELSPPSSPVSPSSPLFYYDGSNPSSPAKGLNTTMASPQSQKAVLGASALSSRAQTASNMLNELERLHSFDHQSAFGMNNNEESVELNMNLFEELADIEYTPPEDNIKMFEVPTVAVTPPSPAVVLPSNDKLSQEFKSIVESLTTSKSGNSIIPTAATTTINNVVTLHDLFQITGIPTTTVVGDECLIPVEFIGRPSTTGENLGPEEAESMDLDGIIISSDMELINEHDLFSLEDLSAELIGEAFSNADDESTMLVDGVMPHWAKNLSIPVDELDTAMNKNDQTLNALLQGNVSAAKNVISPPTNTLQVFSPISNASDDIDDVILEEAEVIEVIEKPAPAAKKTERRGRKPIKKNNLNYVKDKALRKKEQNKTAATRYRIKKKEELTVTLAEEDELQAVHDELDKEKQKLGGEIRIIRSLLRDMLQARKKRPSVTPAATRLTASSIVQAQRIANRRK